MMKLDLKRICPKVGKEVISLSLPLFLKKCNSAQLSSPLLSSRPFCAPLASPSPSFGLFCIKSRGKSKYSPAEAYFQTPPPPPAYLRACTEERRGKFYAGMANLAAPFAADYLREARRIVARDLFTIDKTHPSRREVANTFAGKKAMIASAHNPGCEGDIPPKLNKWSGTLVKKRISLTSAQKKREKDESLPSEWRSPLSFLLFYASLTPDYHVYTHAPTHPSPPLISSPFSSAIFSLARAFAPPTLAASASISGRGRQSKAGGERERESQHCAIARGRTTKA